jgi:ABC-2 type transport system ATP-binding protein
MSESLRVNNLCKTFDSFALKNVSFSLPKGAVMGFIGENGAGKTTTIKLILNLLKKETGTIEVLGKDYLEEETAIKSEIGVVLSEAFFPDELNLKQIGEILKKIYPTYSSQSFRDLAQLFQLPMSKNLKEFSSGMKMKAKLVVAMSHAPKLLILDEPTTGLDPVARAELLDILREYVQDEEKSIFMSSHITDDLEKIADYITLIHNGEIIFSESKEDLFDRYTILKCGQSQFDTLNPSDVIRYQKKEFGYEVLAENETALRKQYPEAIFDPIRLDDLMLLFVKGETK